MYEKAKFVCFIYMHPQKVKFKSVQTNMKQISYKNLSLVSGYDKKSVPRTTVWNHKACQVMTNGDPEEQIFLSHPRTKKGYFFLLTIKFCIFIFKKLPEVPDYVC